MTDKLKPCPFCGSEYLEFKFWHGRGDMHEDAFAYIECKSCEMRNVFCFEDSDEWTEAQALKVAGSKWNDRATMTNILTQTAPVMLYKEY